MDKPVGGRDVGVRPRPVVLEAITDATVPPLPPHITIEQAKKLASALFAGEPEAKDVIKRSFAGKVKEFLVRN